MAWLFKEACLRACQEANQESSPACSPLLATTVNLYDPRSGALNKKSHQRQMLLLNVSCGRGWSVHQTDKLPSSNKWLASHTNNQHLWEEAIDHLIVISSYKLKHFILFCKRKKNSSGHLNQIKLEHDFLCVPNMENITQAALETVPINSFWRE